MNRTSSTQTSHDFDHNLTEIVEHLMCTRGGHGRISLPVIDPQGQMPLLNVKTDRAGIMEHDPPEVGDLELPRRPPLHPPRTWRRNLHTYVVQPHWRGTYSRKANQNTRLNAGCAKTRKAEKEKIDS